MLCIKPLMDNLQSVTYQTFEQDPVKYRQYEEVSGIRWPRMRCRLFEQAIYAAISEWPNKTDKMYVHFLTSPTASHCMQGAMCRRSRPRTLGRAMFESASASKSRRLRLRVGKESECLCYVCSVRLFLSCLAEPPGVKIATTRAR